MKIKIHYDAVTRNILKWGLYPAVYITETPVIVLELDKSVLIALKDFYRIGPTLTGVELKGYVEVSAVIKKIKAKGEGTGELTISLKNNDGSVVVDSDRPLSIYSEYGIFDKSVTTVSGVAVTSLQIWDTSETVVTVSDPLELFRPGNIVIEGIK